MQPCFLPCARDTKQIRAAPRPSLRSWGRGKEVVLKGGVTSASAARYVLVLGYDVCLAWAHQVHACLVLEEPEAGHSWLATG